MKHCRITFHKISIIIFIFLSIINICNCWLIKYNIIFLSENQILYIYSSLAQVIGVLLGLTIAGYSVIDAKIQSIGTEDDTITEYMENLRSDYFNTFFVSDSI